MTPQIQKIGKLSKIVFDKKVSLLNYEFDDIGNVLEWVIYSSTAPSIGIEASISQSSSELMEYVREHSDGKKLGVVENEMSDIYTWENNFGNWELKALVTKVKRKTNYFSVITCKDI